MIKINNEKELEYFLRKIANKSLTESDFEKMMKDDKGVFVDVKGIFRNKIEKLEYWSL